MPGADARGLPENVELRNKLEALRAGLEGIKADIASISNRGAIYSLGPVRSAIIEREGPRLPVGWSCHPKGPLFWSELHSLEAAEMSSAIEDIESRIGLIQLIVAGTAS